MCPKLVEYIPELQDLYNEELMLSGGDELSAHNVYGDVLNPYLEEILQSEEKENKNREVLERIFHFIEILACMENSYMQNVMQVTVCEGFFGLGVPPRVEERAKHYMKPKTKELFLEIKNYWENFKNISSE